MTLKEIEELAGHRALSPWVIKLVGDAVSKEREACAKLCDDIDAEYEGEDVLATWCSKAIRARGKSDT